LIFLTAAKEKLSFTSIMPRSSLVPSGFGIFKNASTSPTAGTKSGTKGLIFVSKSTLYGLKR
jgi:hypothetical protein